MPLNEVQRILVEPALQRVLQQKEWTEDQALTVLQAQQRSGLSVLAFSRAAGLKDGRLYPWQRRLMPAPARSTRKPAGLAPLPPPQSDSALPQLPAPFVPLRRAEPSPPELGPHSVCAELWHPSGWRLRLTPQTPGEWLPLLGRALGAPC